MRRTPLVIHVPHASTDIPPEAMADFHADESELRRFIGIITDHFTDDLFAVEGEDVTAVRHNVSRIVVDPERFDDDMEEPMAARGYGVLYERGADKLPIRPRPSPERREWLLDRWYRPHHARLTEAVSSGLAKAGRVLIIDAHSFPDLPLPHDVDQSTPRPDVCIGKWGMHTPPALIDAASAFCERMGMTLGVDWPYAGTIVPSRYFNKTPEVMSIMIEINRACYMNLIGNDAKRCDRYAATKAFVAGLIGELGTAADRVRLDP